MANPCLGCGNDVGDENPPSPAHCNACPPWACTACGEPCSNASLCACWVSVEGLALADLKAIFAAEGLSLSSPSTTDEGA